MTLNIPAWIVTSFFTTCIMYIVVYKRVKDSGQRFERLTLKFSVMVFLVWLLFAFYFANEQNVQLQWMILGVGIFLLAVIQAFFFILPFYRRK